MNRPIVYLKLIICISLFCNISTSTAQSQVNKANNNFNFYINADPQMGEQETSNSRLKTLNKLLSLFVAEVNSEKKQPSFVVWNGDLVWKPNQASFDNFERIIQPLQPKSILVHGNHDGTEGDDKFFKLQKKVMGFEKLHYSFDHENWHFVVIGSQEKYPTAKKKQALLTWLKKDLELNKNKPTMLFMHYHILPTGISQMEFYTFSPIKFKNKLLDLITDVGNVKYVYSGHVHIGVKASVKTALKYKNTTFILPPSPVPGRPFGEEYDYYDQPGQEFDDKGYYLEVRVEGENVNLIGHKIGHPKKTEYPVKDIKKFTKNLDVRSFSHEAAFIPNETLLNGDFSEGLSHWYSSWRYQADKEPAYLNYVDQKSNTIAYQSKYGYWAQDEYLENFQVIKYQENTQLQIEFEIPKKYQGGGGYFRLFGYNKEKLVSIGLIHWGDEEYKVKYMHQSWAYNATGQRRHPFWLNKKIQNKTMSSFTLNPVIEQSNTVLINTDEFMKVSDLPITKIGIAYGVWGRVNAFSTPFESMLKVNSISVKQTTQPLLPQITFNGAAQTQQDLSVAYGKVYEQKSE